ncbi:MAG: metallophosphoesterase family protein [Ruminiclostridium sp.]
MTESQEKFMERIALISDIHANIHALQVFMDYIDKDSSITCILNMGDFIQIGPNPAEVYDIVMNDNRFVNIMGNSEYMFFNEDIRQHYESEAEHQHWVAEQLGDERMERLKNIPLSRIVEAEGKTILMVHARINSVTDAPLLYQQKTFEEFISDYSTDVNYVAIGHTHLPLYAVHWNGKPVINPGSIGCGKDGIARFAVMDINDSLVDISYKQLKYDKEKVITDYNKNKVPCKDKFISMFY